MPPQSNPRKVNVEVPLTNVRPPDVVNAAQDISRSMTAYFQSVLASTRAAL
jgi:hypothetical protein